MKDNTLIWEVSWETCVQVGGVYSFLQSRIRSMKKRYGSQYFMIGPFIRGSVTEELLPVSTQCDLPAVNIAIEQMKRMGFEVQYRCYFTDYAVVPVILFNIDIAPERLNEIKYKFWESYGTDLWYSSSLFDQALVFGKLFRLFVEKVSESLPRDRDILIHFHEWLSAAALPEFTRTELPVTTVFTTHATILGRYLTSNRASESNDLYHANPEETARQFGILPEFTMERNAIVHAHAFNTTAPSVALESRFFYGRDPDRVVPCGVDPFRYETYSAQTDQRNRNYLLDFF